jgi:hypothetical protein
MFGRVCHAMPCCRFVVKTANHPCTPLGCFGPCAAAGDGFIYHITINGVGRAINTAQRRLWNKIVASSDGQRVLAAAGTSGASNLFYTPDAGATLT